MGFLDLDLPCDIRDIIADVRNLAKADDIKWDMIAMLGLDLIGVIPVIGALKYSDEIGTLFKNADKVSVVARSTDGAGVLAKHADEAAAWLHGVKVFRYSDETAEAVASGEKLLKESGTIYESFADMMSPEDAKRYLDFLENGSREGLTSAELAGVEKADALLVSQKVGYEDVWDLRNVGDALESGSKTINGLNIIDGKVDGKIPLAEYKKYRVDSVHNIDSDTMTLGKYEPTIRADGTKDFSIPGPGAYTVKAGDTTYFSLGTEWDKITDTYGLDVAGQNMFDYFNKPALDDAVNAGKEIRFSHNPEAYGECALKWEWDYLQEKHGYFALEKKGDFWYATK